LLKGAGWGIVITLGGEIQTGTILPPDALKITEAVWLQMDVGWRPSDEELKFLQLGLRLVAGNVETSCRGRPPVLVHLTRLHYNPTDYQPEGLVAAVAEWTAQMCAFPKPEIPVAYNRAQRRYIFDFSLTRTDRPIALDGEHELQGKAKTTEPSGLVGADLHRQVDND
jgi:hypothetical protein